MASAWPRLCGCAINGWEAETGNYQWQFNTFAAKKGVPYFRSEGVEHDVINASDGEYAFIEIEIK